MRTYFNNLNKNKKLNDFLTKYNISKDFFSTRRKFILRGSILGLSIAFIPMPMQMLAVLLFMPIFRFNMPIAIAMCWITNPLTMPFIYMIEYNVGSFILGTSIENIQFDLDWISNNFFTIFLPLYTGAIFLSTISSTIAYFTINYLWKKSIINRRG